jgi:hypothetical protein
MSTFPAIYSGLLSSYKENSGLDEAGRQGSIRRGGFMRASCSPALAGRIAG